MEIFIVVLVVVILVAFIAAMIGNKRRNQEPLPPAVDVEGEALKCLRCAGPMGSMGVDDLRLGGTTGGSKLVFGELAELGEHKLELDFMGCAQCGHVELRIPMQS